MTAVPYIYHPLKNDEIRLVTIQHDSSNPDMICCALEHVSLPSISNLPSKPDFKGNDFVWPESRDSYDISALFKKDAKPHVPKVLPLSSSSPSGSDTVEGQPWRHSWGDYMALSYVWGAPTPVRQIMLDGHRFRVTPNLFDALFHLRQNQRVRQGFKVWIDAICINQADLIERGQQVTRMRDIFASAWQVVMWLGGEADDSELAFTSLYWLSQLSRSVTASTILYREKKKIDARPLFIMWTRYESPLRKEVYKALFHLLTRPYWRRMWILQEVAMARVDAPVICGNRCLSWTDIYHSIRFIAGDEGRFGRDIIDSVRPRILRTWTFEFARSRNIQEREWASERMWKLLMDMMTIQHRQKQTASLDVDLDFLQPLLLSREAAVTEEKDRVYGILGIKEIADRVTIAPDYTISLSAIYQNFTAQLLSNGNLDVLRLISRGAGFIYTSRSFDDIPPLLKRHSAIPPLVSPFFHLFESSNKTVFVGTECPHTLPSWVVCWTCKPAPTARLQGPYNANGSTLSPSIVPLADSSLIVRGIIFDSLSSLSSFHQREVDTRYPLNASQSHQNQYGNLEATRTALWMTIVGGIKAEGGFRAPEAYSWLLDPRIWQLGVAGVYCNGFGLHEFMARNKNLVLCGRKLSELIFGAKRSYLSWKQNKEGNSVRLGQFYNPTEEQCEALSWAMNIMAWRRLVGTEKGRIGLSPAAAEAGDEVATFLGCSTPIILRRWADGWKVIGECYIHGVMDGEVVASDRELSDIKLY